MPSISRKNYYQKIEINSSNKGKRDIGQNQNRQKIDYSLQSRVAEKDGLNRRLIQNQHRVNMCRKYKRNTGKRNRSFQKA